MDRSVRIEADIRTTGDQRIEVRGLGSEIYADSKHGVKAVGSAVKSVTAVPGQAADALLRTFDSPWVTVLLLSFVVAAFAVIALLFLFS